MHRGFFLPWMPLLAIAGVAACGVSSSPGERIDAVEHTAMAEGSRIATEQAKLTASDGEQSDFFGRSVAVSGDTAVAGAFGDDDKGSLSGSAYAFVRSSDGWTEQQKLTASDGAEGDGLGQSIALAGDTAVVGAVPWDVYFEQGRPGGAYVFVRSGDVWAEQQKLTAIDQAAKDAFGWSVAVEGDTAVVGAPLADAEGIDTGAVYVFTRSGDTWTQAQKLTASHGVTGSFFGWSVSMAGDTVVVGAPVDVKDASGEATGAAYVFVREGDVWTEQAKLTAEDGTLEDLFGLSVAVAGDTAVVGAGGVSDKGEASGSAYILVREGKVWTEAQKLTASDGTEYAIFGWSVALSGGAAVVGAPLQEGAAGAAYVFVPEGSVWTERRKLTVSDPAEGDLLGASVAIAADTVVAGAPGKDGLAEDGGAAYVFASLESEGATRKTAQNTGFDKSAQ